MVQIHTRMGTLVHRPSESISLVAKVVVQALKRIAFIVMGKAVRSFSEYCAVQNINARM